MNRKIILLVWIVALSLNVFSQGQGNTWVFGDSAGVQFIGGQPFAISSVVNSSECSASISDLRGNLLFYNASDGGFGGTGYFNTKVWDKTNQVMPNGTGLKGCSSTTQGCLIVPFPNDSEQYYIFNIPLQTTPPYHNLYYSIVNMSLNNGLGDVSQKNILLCDTTLSEKLIAVKHGNGRDWWIITRTSFDTKFFLYLITPYSINGPFIQSIGDSLNTSGHMGQMAINGVGDQLVYAGLDGQLALFDFDRCSGLFSNFHPLGDITSSVTTGYYGCSFSPNDSLLYGSSFDSLFQFNLTAANIKLSKTFIAQLPGTYLGMGQHLLAPDHKIYLATSFYGFTPYCDSLKTHLSVINNPNVLGTGCNFSAFSLQLANCTEVSIGLPNMPNYNLGSLIGSVCDTVTAIEEISNSYRVSVYPNPAKDVCTITANKFINSTLSLYDITGRALLQQPFTATATLDISNLTNGVYIAEVKDKEGRSVKGKVVKE